MIHHKSMRALPESVRLMRPSFVLCPFLSLLRPLGDPRIAKALPQTTSLVTESGGSSSRNPIVN